MRPVTDGQTGIELVLPLDLLGPGKPGKWGTNWQSSNNRLSVDTLNFGTERTLAEVYATLKGIKGRRLTKDVLNPQNFVLEGTDSDGSAFYSASL
jgi:hypothetical protein